MGRVSYQLPPEPGRPQSSKFVPVATDAIATRGRDAKATFTVTLSKPQSRWLARAGAGAGSDALVRAMVDLAMELDIDWARIRRPAELRRAIADAVLVRRR